MPVNSSSPLPRPAASTPGHDERDYSVRAVQRVCSILTLLQQSVRGVSLPEVASVTDLPKSSAFRYLWTLERYRYVERQLETGLYQVGLGFLGMQSRQLEVLRERARPWLEKLRDQFGETINLGILDGDSVIYLDIVESARGVRLAARPGDRDPIYSTALGKAIAAHFPEERVRELLQHVDMSPRTANTITTVGDFLHELGQGAASRLRHRRRRERNRWALRRGSHPRHPVAYRSQPQRPRRAMSTQGRRARSGSPSYGGRADRRDAP